MQIVELLLVNLEKSGLGSKVACGPFFAIIKNGECHELRTYVLFLSIFVNSNAHSLEKRAVLITLIFRVSGNIIDLRKPLFSILEPPDYPD